MTGCETGWDLGPFAGNWAPLLQCLHLDTLLFEQQNTKKLYGTKNNCMHAQYRANPGQKIQRPKSQWKLLKSLEQKQGTEHAPCTPKGWANHLRQPSGLSPGHTPPLTPYKEQACLPLPSGNEQTRERVVCSQSPCCSTGPNKALPGFLCWPLINFCWLRRPRTLVGNSCCKSQLLNGNHKCWTREALSKWWLLLIDGLVCLHFPHNDEHFQKNILYIAIWCTFEASISFPNLLFLAGVVKCWWEGVWWGERGLSKLKMFLVCKAWRGPIFILQSSDNLALVQTELSQPYPKSLTLRNKCEGQGRKKEGRGGRKEGRSVKQSRTLIHCWWECKWCGCFGKKSGNSSKA